MTTQLLLKQDCNGIVTPPRLGTISQRSWQTYRRGKARTADESLIAGKMPNKTMHPSRRTSVLLMVRLLRRLGDRWSFGVIGCRDGQGIHRHFNCQSCRSKAQPRCYGCWLAAAGSRDWWANERHKFELVTSQLTLDESVDGDPAAAADRLKMLQGLPLVDITSDVEAMAARLIQAHTMPEKAAADAVHVAAAALGGVDYLLTLNCKHIAKAHELPRIYELLDREGLGRLLICTPAEFLGDSDDEQQSNT